MTLRLNPDLQASRTHLNSHIVCTEPEWHFLDKLSRKKERDREQETATLNKLYTPCWSYFRKTPNSLKDLVTEFRPQANIGDIGGVTGGCKEWSAIFGCVHHSLTSGDFCGSHEDRDELHYEPI